MLFRSHPFMNPDGSVCAVRLRCSLFGLFVGAVPGLTATMATALLVPVTFFMAPIPAIAAIVSAIFITSAMRLAAGTTRETRPERSASAASMTSAI